jgi:hypothetical protein
MKTDSHELFSSESKDIEREKSFSLYSLVLLVIVLWLGWYAWVSYLFEGAIVPKIGANIDDAGTYGDLFGGINALFTGLGLAFLAYTIQQQQSMIAHQTEALDLQSQDLTEQQKANSRTQALQAILQLRSVLQDEETRKARSLILSGAGKPSTPTKITEALLKKELGLELDGKEKAALDWHYAAEKTLHTYDFVGVLWKGGFLEENDLQVIKDTWGESIARCHEQLEEYLTTPFRPKGRELHQFSSHLNHLIQAEEFTEAVNWLSEKSQLHKLTYDNFVELNKKLRSMQNSACQI